MTMRERWSWIEAVHDAVMESRNTDDFDGLRLWWQELLDLNNS